MNAGHRLLPAPAATASIVTARRRCQLPGRSLSGAVSRLALGIRSTYLFAASLLHVFILSICVVANEQSYH